MKIRRQKHVRRVLTFYKNNFDIHPPYFILVDGTFCRSALQFQVNLSEQMPKYLNSEVKFFTTRCVKEECESLGSLLYGPLKILQQYPNLTCGHSPAVSPLVCLLSTAKKYMQSDKKLFVATQDPDLSEKVRETPGIPLMFISHNAINIEAPSISNKTLSDDKEFKKLIPNEVEAKRLQTLKETVLGSEEVKIRKRKKKGGPNPLSCKKKKKKIVKSDSEKSGDKKRQRHRKRHKKINISNAPSL